MNDQGRARALLYSDTNAHRSIASSLQGLLGTYLLNDVSEESPFGWASVGLVFLTMVWLSQSSKRVGAIRASSPGIVAAARQGTLADPVRDRGQRVALSAVRIRSATTPGLEIMATWELSTSTTLVVARRAMKRTLSVPMVLSAVATSATQARAVGSPIRPQAERASPAGVRTGRNQRRAPRHRRAPEP